MLTKRTLLMTATGLLIGYLAAAQSTAPAPAETGSDVLFWVLVGILGLVVLMVLVTGASVATATARPHWQQAGPAHSSSHPTPVEEGTPPC